jgi:hypothetical protein
LSETASIEASFTIQEQGTATEGTPSIALAEAETASSSDQSTLSIVQDVAGAETGSLGENVSVAVTLGGQDSFDEDDAASSTAVLAAADASLGVDAGVVTAPFFAEDFFAAAEGSSLAIHEFRQAAETIAASYQALVNASLQDGDLAALLEDGSVGGTLLFGLSAILTLVAAPRAVLLAAATPAATITPVLYRASIVPLARPEATLTRVRPKATVTPAEE